MKRRILFAVLCLCISVAGAGSDCHSAIFAYWKLDGNASDGIGGFDGSGFPLTEYDFIVADAAKFDGSQNITAGSDDTFNLRSGFTIMFWFKKTGTSYEKSSLIRRDNYEIFYEPKSDYTASYVKAIFGSKTVSSLELNLRNTNYFVALTGNKSDLSLSLYINGELHNTASLSPADFASHVSSDLVFGEGFEGIIDEIAFFDEPLSDEDIFAYYNASKGGKDYCDESLGALGSSAETVFTIAGCNIAGYGILQPDMCSGNYYCNAFGDDYIALNTVIEANACLGGKTSLSSGERGCCPEGYYCTNEDIPDDNYYCRQLTRDCTNITVKSKCEQEFCFWIDDGISSHCTGTLSGLGCSSYKSQTACEGDYYLLSKFGYGTENCERFDFGITCSQRFTVQGCNCQWKNDKCVLSYNLTSTQVGANDEPSQYTCEKFFEMGECVDGSQNISWTTIFKDKDGNEIVNPSSEMEQECIIDGIDCKDGSSIRYCGDDTIKAPGFSIFAFIASTLIIAAIYILKLKKPVNGKSSP